MSYILEALKKSKEERQNEDVPHLHIVHGGPVYKPGLKQFFRPGMLFAGLGAVCVAGGLLFLIQTGEDIKDTVKKNQRIHLGQIEIREEFFGQPEDSVVVQNSTGGSTGVSDQQVVRIPRTVSKQVLPQSSVVVEQGADTNQGIQFRRELPENIQKDLPQLVFAGHTYADDPRQRMIIINNTILREGDSIDGDTQLLSIIWEGVVLQHKGVVFQQRTH